MCSLVHQLHGVKSHVNRELCNLTRGLVLRFLVFNFGLLCSYGSGAVWMLVWYHKQVNASQKYMHRKTIYRVRQARSPTIGMSKCCNGRTTSRNVYTRNKRLSPLALCCGRIYIVNHRKTWFIAPRRSQLPYQIHNSRVERRDRAALVLTDIYGRAPRRVSNSNVFLRLRIIRCARSLMLCYY